MENKAWPFFALSFLCVTYLILGENTYLGFFLFALWFIRILYLKERKMIVSILLFTAMTIIIVSGHQVKNKSFITAEEKTFLLVVQPNSLKVDGDYLSAIGTIRGKGPIKNQEKLALQYYIPSKEEQKRWKHSIPPAQLLVEGELVQPSSNTNFHQFNYQAYLKRQKIHWQFKAEKIKILPVKPTISQRLANLRFQILQAIDRKFDETLASYLKNLFFGDKSALADPIKESYRALGLVHLFSISGFHISYLTKIFQVFLLRLGISRERTHLILIIILPFYALMAGWGISLFRAVSQKIIQILSILLNKKISSLDAWSLTLIFTLTLNPYYLFELAFQLSYSLSALFIIMSQRDWRSELGRFKENLLLSGLALLVSSPILTYHFYEISWFTLLTNLLFIPLFIYIFIPTLTILLILSLLWSDSLIFMMLNQGVAIVLRQFEDIILTVTQRYNLSVIIGRLPVFILLILIGLILYSIKKIEQKQRITFLVPIILCLCFMWNRLLPFGYVLILDVGQGDAILIKDPDTQRVTLIDTGGRVQWQEKESWRQREKDFTIGKNVVVPAIKSLGVSQIDRLYISHAHADHMGELKNIYEELTIKEIAAGKESLEDASLKKQLAGISPEKILDLQNTTVLSYPTSGSLLVHPKIAYPDKNNQSLVFYVKMGEDKWLFTGDLETAGEKDLIQNYPSLRIDYLKAGHHGSLTSSTEEFIDHIQPKIAFISAGENNNYGHPSPEVLDRFQRKEIDFYLTANDGAIKVNYIKFPFINECFKKIETVN